MKQYEKNILIIDDNLEDARRIFRLLELQLSQNVRIKIDALPDLKMISRIAGLDVIIFDINFKNGKWIDVITSIRLYHENTPLIIFTNLVDQYYYKLCSLMGVHLLMDKTTQINQLPLVLQEILACDHLKANL